MHLIKIGIVHEIVRYPVKSMAGTSVESAELGWHGLAGDRRFAYRRLDDRSGFPWLNGSRLPELLLYHPHSLGEDTSDPLPTHVRTPSGEDLELSSEALRSEIAARFGSDVELMNLKNGIFDDAYVSVISLPTVARICQDAGLHVDTRRFRANIVLETNDPAEFREDAWIGGTLSFGGSTPEAEVAITAGDVRCMMINLDPDNARQDARVLKAAVRLNKTIAGVYGVVVRTGTVRVGQEVSFKYTNQNGA